MPTQTSQSFRHGLTFDLSHPQALLRRMVQFLRAKLHHAAERRRALADFKKFLGMSDHILRDIGLTREQVLQDRLRYRLTGELPDYND